MLELLRRFPSALTTWVAPNLRYFTLTRQPVVWGLAIGIGTIVALAALLFRLSIGLYQYPWLQSVSERVGTLAAGQPWWVILAAPTIGGLLVGWYLQRIQAGRRASSVADVIEARALGGRSLKFWPGISSAFVTALSLGSGASAGREGPVVHLGATIGAALCRAFQLPVSSRRVLLACGVASAVSASFNAPIAGVLFAHEVILGHYAMSAFVPIVISSAVGTVLSRQLIGDVAAFVVPSYQITSYWEIPAFALLGLTCAAVAIIFQFALIGTDFVARNIKMKLWMRPAIGGAMVGAIAIYFPQVLGVGYETTDMALKQELTLGLLFALLIAKTAATAITLASRFGGGIFSPALYLGAMTGGVYGLIAASVFPELASSQGLYAILGMGAVAAAVLGAPISTTMIVFELTGGYALSIALLLAVSIATGLTQAIHGRSFFHRQLEMRGTFLQEGGHRHLVKSVLVSDFMDPIGDDDDPPELDPELPVLRRSNTLEDALKAFDSSGRSQLAVVTGADPPQAVGWADHVKALRYFNSALIDASVEEHR